MFRRILNSDSPEYWLHFLQGSADMAIKRIRQHVERISATGLQHEDLAKIKQVLLALDFALDEARRGIQHDAKIATTLGSFDDRSQQRNQATI